LHDALPILRPRCAISLSRSIALAGVSSRPAQSGRRRDGVLTREPAIGVAGALLGIIMFVLSPRLMLGDKRRSFGCRRVAFFHFQYFSTVNHSTVILHRTRQKVVLPASTWLQ